MVKKFLTFINKEFNGINEAALLLGLLTFSSQILGLVRDRLLASKVGAGSTLDIYYAAFRIPDFLYVSVASLISVTVLLPLLVEKMISGQNKIEAKRFMSQMFTAFILFMLFVSVIIYIFMPSLAKLIAPGFSQKDLSELVTVSRLMLFSPIFIGISNMFGAITQAYKKFFIFSLSPIFYNLGIILGILFIYPSLGIVGLSFGVVIGAILHLLVQVPTVFFTGLFPRIVFSLNIKEVLSVARISLPRTLALASGNLSFLAIIAIASTVGSGAISLFTFSYNLQSVPVGIIGISFSVAAFPVLVQVFKKHDVESFVSYVADSAKQIIFWSLPTIALFVVLRAQIVRVILGVDSFSWSDTRLTAATLAIFVLSLATQGLVFLFVRAYYAAGNTKRPLVVNMLSAFLTIALSFIFIKAFRENPAFLKLIENILRVDNLPNTLMLALPLAYIIGSFFNLFFLWKLFRKDFFQKKSFGIRNTFWESVMSSLLIGMVTYFFLGVFDNIFSLSTFWGIFAQGLFSGVIGVLFGATLLYIMKNEQLLSVLEALKHKFWKNKPISEGQREL